MQVLEVIVQVLEVIVQVLEVKMQVVMQKCRSWPELMSEGKETLLEKKKANGTMLGSNFILSIIFVSECNLSLIGVPNIM